MAPDSYISMHFFLPHFMFARYNYRATRKESMSNNYLDGIAFYRTHLYGDWSSLVSHQGMALSSLLESLGVTKTHLIHDASAGAGLNVLGLWNQGYKLTASDPSQVAVAMLKAELAKRSVEVNTFVSGLDELSRLPLIAPNVVMVLDNYFSFLGSNEKILLALKHIKNLLLPNGLVVSSTYDYSTISRDRPYFRPYCVKNIDGLKFMAVETWEWDGDCYFLNMHLNRELLDKTWKTETLKARCCATSIQLLIRLFEDAGFIEVQRIDDALDYPVIIGRKPGSSLA